MRTLTNTAGDLPYKTGDFLSAWTYCLASQVGHSSLELMTVINQTWCNGESIYTGSNVICFSQCKELGALAVPVTSVPANSSETKIKICTGGCAYVP